MAYYDLDQDYSYDVDIDPSLYDEDYDNVITGVEETPKEETNILFE